MTDYLAQPVQSKTIVLTKLLLTVLKTGTSSNVDC